ncbi:MAG TPA: amino acid permease [Terriglobales bacterium]|nr:amino acid permease [Terriglobales bacterium]
MDAAVKLSTATAASPALRKELNLFDAVALVVGTIIGSGIFLIPSSIATQLHALWAVLLVWGVGGLLTVCGALSLAELGAMYPAAGGICTYLRQAYGPVPAFLYAWSLLLMIHTGSIAAVSIGFGLYAGQVFALGPVAQKAVCIGCILGLTAINYLGIRSGKWVQNLIVVAKVGGLAGMMLLLFATGTRPIHLLAPASGGGHAFTAAGFGVALVAVLFAYEGWHVISFAAAEMKQPKRVLPHSLLLGSTLVLAIYIVANLAYYHVMTPAQIQASPAVAAQAVGIASGPWAAKALSLLILASLLGCINGLVLTGGRVYYAMAVEGLFPHGFGRMSAQHRTPAAALLAQGVWASLLAASGSYESLFTDVIFTGWIFYGLSAAAVIVLRRRQPERERPFAVPWYPWVPLLFCVAVVGLTVTTIVARPLGALFGLALIASGLPVYYAFIKPRSAPTPS